jgi:23S rRNA (guanosine2251-2'-O)-methyltransferase
MRNISSPGRSSRKTAQGGRKPPEGSTPPHNRAGNPAGGALPRPSVASALLLYGIHPVTAAWLNPERKCRHLYLTAQAAEAMAPALADAARLGLQRPAPLVAERGQIDALLPPDAVHQGIALDAEPLAEMNLDDILIAAGDDPATLVLLDQVTDPHNVGAILRTAAAFGASAIIVQSRHAPEATGALAKAASGALEIVPIVRETNLARAIETLRDAFFDVIGLDERAETAIGDAPMASRVVLALGAEGAGLRRLLLEKCTRLACLPTRPPILSLNVSNAAAIGLYEISRRISATSGDGG